MPWWCANIERPTENWQSTSSLVYRTAPKTNKHSMGSDAQLAYNLWRIHSIYICILSPLTVYFIHKVWYFRFLKWRVFPILIANKFFISLFSYLFTFAINLWHRKIVTADVTAVFVDNQHGIQRRVDDFDKKHTITLSIQVTCVEELKLVHIKCNLFAFFHICWISAVYLNFYFPKVV